MRNDDLPYKLIRPGDLLLPGVVYKLICSCLFVFVASATVQAQPRSIVSLSPHVTELLYAIGAEQQLVATVAYSDYPRAAKMLPRIGDVYQLDWERLLEMHPDLVIGWQDGTPANVLARVEAMGLPLALVRVEKLESIAAQLRQLGKLTGRSVAADAAAKDFLVELAALESRYAGRRRVKVFYEIDHQPLFTINERQIISDAISLCGGVNIFAGLDVLAPQVSMESVLKRDPEVIVYAGTVAAAEDVFADWRRWPRLAAVRHEQLYRADPDLMNRPTPRMLQGVRHLCELIDRAR
ncbi:cobalamin-binding protein [Sulfuriflexus sp.]|uniref:cobalamin-binding protein n=1 Tax=Sulfuriflexus sp. TaxID=2015443 RepID=UPI0028CE26C2|nr:cobalamin-binding protein [Sulfuriflexus sp.]MDT8402996.1 cobalamin-binding protein [Sulfuriflexus sp.]